MSNIYQEAIRGLEQEQEALMQRHGEIAKAIDILTPMAGGAGPTERKKSAKGGGRTDGRTDGANLAPAGRAEPP